jgi:hypothetical protein
MSWFEHEEGEKYDPNEHEFHPDSEGVRQELLRLAPSYPGSPKKRRWVHEHEDGSLTHKIVHDDGSETHVPVTHAYRAVSEDDFHRMREQGHLDTRGEGNMYRSGEQAEGMVASAHPYIHSYIPYDKPGRVLKIKVRPEDGWRKHYIDGDYYLHTPSANHKIPWDRVEDHSVQMEKGTNPDSWNKDHVRLSTEKDKPRTPLEQLPQIQKYEPPPPEPTVHERLAEAGQTIHEHLSEGHGFGDTVTGLTDEQAHRIHNVISPTSPCRWNDHKKAFLHRKESAMDPPLRFVHEVWDRGRQVQAQITAVHPDHGRVGTVTYLAPRQGPGPIRIQRLALQRGGRSYAEALLDQVREHHPQATLAGAQRTAAMRPFLAEAGLDEVQQRALHRLSGLPEMIQGGDAHRLFAQHGIHLHEEDPWEAGEVDDDHLTRGDTGASVHHPADRELHTSQNYLSRSGLEHFIRHPWDGSHGDGPRDERPSTWEHEGQHWINGGHHRLLADRMTFRQGTTVSDRTARTASRHPFAREGFKNPTQRIFGPTYGLDHRLFLGEHLRPEIRDDILNTFEEFCERHGYTNPDSWSRLVFFGSEASNWTSANDEGNGDFDLSLGIEYAKFRLHNSSWADESDEGIASAFTELMHAELNDPAKYFDTAEGRMGPFDQTWFCNPLGYRIEQIKPYAAYDVSAKVWIVKPPTLQHWSIEDFPQGHPLVTEIHAVAAEVRAVLKMPEPYRSQQGDRLWHYIHDGRSQAFSDQGEGWYDTANVLEKACDQLGLWEPLVQLHFAAHADPHLLDAPAGWSNDPAPVA